MRVVLLSSEVAPFAKTGGLGDVVGSLPRYLAELGLDVHVYMPLYQSAEIDDLKLADSGDVEVHFRWMPPLARIRSTIIKKAHFHFVDSPNLYDRAGLYGEHSHDYSDNFQRFAYFSYAVLAHQARLGIPVDILHANDWQTGLAPLYLRTQFRNHDVFRATRSLFTIHNIAYQGRFYKELLPDAGLGWDVFTKDVLEYYDDINCMKAGITTSDWVSTVSQQYMREICTPDFGYDLDRVLIARQNRLIGIVNGIDYNEWNPETDPNLYGMNYSASAFTAKELIKERFLAEVGLQYDPRTMVIGSVSRMVSQKGLELPLAAVERTLDLPIQWAIFGNGDAFYENAWREMARQQPDRVSVGIGFSKQIAHRMEAGVDVFMMPSRFEPCGLSQMYSLRYGTVPLVRHTGGLADTIQDGANGVVFHEFSVESFVDAVRRAYKLFQDKVAWMRLIKTGMAQDWSWTSSAKRYKSLYIKMLESV